MWDCGSPQPAAPPVPHPHPTPRYTSGLGYKPHTWTHGTKEGPSGEDTRVEQARKCTPTPPRAPPIRSAGVGWGWAATVGLDRDPAGQSWFAFSHHSFLCRDPGPPKRSGLGLRCAGQVRAPPVGHSPHLGARSQAHKTNHRSPWSMPFPRNRPSGPLGGASVPGHGRGCDQAEGPPPAATSPRSWFWAMHRGSGHRPDGHGPARATLPLSLLPGDRPEKILKKSPPHPHCFRNGHKIQQNNPRLWVPVGPSVLGLALEPRSAQGEHRCWKPPTPTLTREPNAPGLPPPGSHQRQDCQRPWAAVLFLQKKKERKKNG